MPRPKVHQLSTSPGGLPKYAVPQAELSAEGLAGDVHRNTRVHGGPRQAVLIVTLEGIAELKAQGFELYPGGLAENITTEGLDRRTLRAGQRYRIGAEVIVELTKLRSPCASLEASVPGLGKAVYDPQCKANDPASPRWALGGFYARVVRGGQLRPGAPIIYLDEDA